MQFFQDRTPGEWETNTYSVSIMRQALEALSDESSFNSEGIEVKETHQYIMLKLENHVFFEELKESVDLYDYPLLSSSNSSSNKEIRVAGSKVRYAIVPANTSLPDVSNIILSSLYIPEFLLEDRDRYKDFKLLVTKATELAQLSNSTVAPKDNSNSFFSYETITGKTGNPYTINSSHAHLYVWGSFWENWIDKLVSRVGSPEEADAIWTLFNEYGKDGF